MGVCSVCRGGSVVPDIGAITLLNPLPVPVGLQQQGGVGPGENTAGRHDMEDMILSHTAFSITFRRKIYNLQKRED